MHVFIFMRTYFVINIPPQDFLALGKRRKRKLSNAKHLSALSASSDSEDDVVNKEIGGHAITSTTKAILENDQMANVLENADHEEGEVSDKENERSKEISDTSSGSSDSTSSESSSDSEFDDGYDENLMGDEEDRKRLSCLSEKERETEIFKRIEQRDIMRTRWEIERKLKLARRGEKTTSQTKSKLKKEKKKKSKKSLAPTTVLEGAMEVEISAKMGNNVPVDDMEPFDTSETNDHASSNVVNDEATSGNGEYFDHKERSKERKKNVEMNRTDDKRSNAMALLKAKREGKAKRGNFVCILFIKIY